MQLDRRLAEFPDTGAGVGVRPIYAGARIRARVFFIWCRSARPGFVCAAAKHLIYRDNQKKCEKYRLGLHHAANCVYDSSVA